MEEIKYCAVKCIRLSNADDKPGESDSVQNQRKLIDEWLKNHPEIEVVEEKIDDGVSGLIFDRPQFKEMMADIESGKINCCVCKDLSRFGRESVETGRYLRRISPAYGVRFIAINDNIDTLKDSCDDLTVSLKTIINDSYSRDISIKTRSALNIKRKNGDYIGACPVYGYKKSDENHNKLVPDEYAAGVVADIYKMKLTGLASARIAEKLNKLGISSPYQYKKDKGLPHPKKGFADVENAKWSAKAVIRILTDITYTGTLVQGKTGTPNYKLKDLQQKPESEWQYTENAHKPIISKIDFELVQQLMKLDTRIAPNSDKVYVFSGMLICGCCGNRMVRKSAPGKNGKKYYNYWCPTTKKGGCHDSHLIKEDTLVECILQNIKAHISNIVSVEEVLANLDADRIGRELAEKLNTQLSENEKRLDKIREFKAGLYENMISGILSKDEYKSLKAKYTEDSDLLLSANEQIKKEIDETLSCNHERMMWTKQFHEYENLQTLDRKIVATLIKYIRITGKKKIEIEFNYSEEFETALAVAEKEVV